jgi:hypothetical protein
MPRGKAVDYAQPLTPYERSDEEYRQLAISTKLRTLADMSEREIRALERYYKCPVIRPEVRNRRRRAPGHAVAA